MEHVTSILFFAALVFILFMSALVLDSTDKSSKSYKIALINHGAMYAAIFLFIIGWVM